MPSLNITQEPTTLLRYDVVGQRVEGQSHFVKHVGLFDEDNQFLRMGDTAKVLHMKPPLKEGDEITVDVAGRVPLTNDERKIIETWHEKIKDEYSKLLHEDQFIIHPPWKDQCDLNTGSRRYRRYSCVGFVLYSHLRLDIPLLQIDEELLPKVYPETIEAAYGLVPGLLLSKFGLEGNGPWRIVLPGYIMHALNRSTEKIRNEPYRAKEGDDQF